MGFLQRDRKSCVHPACHLSLEVSNKLDLFLWWQNPVQIWRPDLFKTQITLLLWFCSWGLCLSLLRGGKREQKCMGGVCIWKTERDGGRPRLLNIKDAPTTAQEIPCPMFPSLILHQKLCIPACCGLELCVIWMPFHRQVKRTTSETGPGSCDFLCLISDQFTSKKIQQQYYIYRLLVPVLSQELIQWRFFTRLKYLFHIHTL